MISVRERLGCAKDGFRNGAEAGRGFLFEARRGMANGVLSFSQVFLHEDGGGRERRAVPRPSFFILVTLAGSFITFTTWLLLYCLGPLQHYPTPTLACLSCSGSPPTSLPSSPYVAKRSRSPPFKVALTTPRPITLVRFNLVLVKSRRPLPFTAHPTRLGPSYLDPAILEVAFQPENPP